MKKQLFLIAGAAVIMASCGGETPKEDPGAAQAKIDSALKAQEAAHEAEMQRQNDSIVAAQKVIADSVAAAEAAAAEAAKKGGKKTTTKKDPKTNPPASPAPPPAPAPAPNPKENRFNEQGTKTVDPASTKKKEDRFK
jgi:Tfp pilus assembly major pilin PilA